MANEIEEQIFIEPLKKQLEKSHISMKTWVELAYEVLKGKKVKRKNKGIGRWMYKKSEYDASRDQSADFPT